MLTNKNIQIAMLEMSPQNKAILEFYFDRAGKNLYKVVNEHSAQAFIIDYDQPSAKQTVKEKLEKNKAPILLVSIKEQNLPSTIWLAKPLTANSLDMAAESLKELIAESEASIAKAEEEAANAKTLADEADAKVMAKQVEDLAEKIEAKAIAEEKAEELHVTEDALADSNEFKVAKLASTSLAITGVGAVLTADNSSETQDNFDTVDLIEEDNVDGIVGLDGLDNNNEVDNLLDSLISDEDIPDQNISDLSSVEQVSEITSDVEEHDIFLDSLEPDTELDTEVILAPDTEETTSEDSFDLLDSLDDDVDETESKPADLGEFNFDSFDAEEPTLEISDDDSLVIDETELKTADLSEFNFESLDTEEPTLEISDADSLDIDQTELTSADLNEFNFESLDTEEPTLEVNGVDTSESIDNNDLATAELFAPDDKLAKLEENFIIHDDIPSTEDVFAETLEVGFDKDEENNLKKVSNELEGLNVGFYDTPEKPEDEEKTNTDETLSEGELENNLFNFDTPIQEIEIVETQLEIENELEITLLDESGIDSDISLLATEDDNDNLDSLLAEVSSESDELDADLDNLLKEITPVEEVPTEVLVETNENIIENTDSDLDNLLESVDGESDEKMDSELQSLLNEVRQEANIPLSSNGIKGSQEATLYDQTKAEKRWMQLCGNLEDIKGQKEVVSISYDKNNHLLGTVLKQINSLENKEKLYRLKYNDLIIVVDRMKNRIFCNMDLLSDEYSEICFNKLNFDDLKIHDLDYSEERLYRSKIDDDPKRAHSMESFIWSTSLLTSRGRLLEDTNVTKKVALKVWPNLTRLELMPHAMHMAAVFSKHPGSLLEIAGWLNIQQRYVFAFYNAALHLDMIELDSNKIKKSGTIFNKKGSKKNSEERGFFGRLLKRLKT